MYHRVISRIALVAFAAAAFSCSVPSGRQQRVAYLVEEKTVAELSTDMAAGAVTSEGLVKLYLERIETLDRAGPKLGSVLAVNPRALEDARRLDTERAEGQHHEAKLAYRRIREYLFDVVLYQSQSRA